MPVITLTWQDSYYTPRTEDYTNQYTWIKEVIWRRFDNNALMPLNGLGVYIVVDSTGGYPGVPVYAGEAVSFRDRFNGRSSALRELGLTAAAVNNRVVRIAAVYPQDELGLAERWLIRYLVMYDYATNHPQRLQNIEKTQSFNAPFGGLTINNNGPRPAYLPAQDNYAAGNPITYP